MRVLVTGSHGLIGGALVDALASSGHQVSRLVRATAGQDEIAWRPNHGVVNAAALEGYDAVVHLAGVGIDDHRWTKSHERAVRRSRLRGTSLLARALASLGWRPGVLVSASR